LGIVLHIYAEESLLEAILKKCSQLKPDPSGNSTI
jgi:hypothetical protein